MSTRTLVLASIAATLLAAPAHAAENPQLSVAPDGTAHVVWAQFDGAAQLGQWGTRLADGTVGEPQYFTPAAVPSAYHDVAAAADGRAIAVWAGVDAGTYRVKLRRRAADGSFGPVQTLSEGGVQGPPKVALDADGNATVVWLRAVAGRTVVEARRRAVTGALSSVKRLSAAAPTYNTNGADVAVDPAGNATVSWTVLAPTSYVQTRRRAEDGTLSAVQNLTSGSGSADLARVAVDSSGNAIFVWRRIREGQFLVQARRRGAAGTLSATQDVSAPSGQIFSPDLSVRPSGTAAIAWHRFAGMGVVLETRRRSSGGTLGTVDTVSAIGANSSGGRVGFDADGDTVFAWRVADGSSTHIAGRRRTAAGAWTVIQELSAVGGTVSDPELGVEPGGGATIGWLRTNASPPAVEVRRRTAAGELSAIDKLSY